MESIHHKPIQDISWDDIEQFCNQHISEGASLDYKREIPERLQNTIAAMANTIRGVILVGIEEDAETKPKLPVSGIPFTKGLSEQVMSIILSNITPPVFPEIHEALSVDKEKAIVVIRIHQKP